MICPLQGWLCEVFALYRRSHLESLRLVDLKDLGSSHEDTEEDSLPQLDGPTGHLEDSRFVLEPFARFCRAHLSLTCRVDGRRGKVQSLGGKSFQFRKLSVRSIGGEMKRFAQYFWISLQWKLAAD